MDQAEPSNPMDIPASAAPVAAARSPSAPAVDSPAASSARPSPRRRPAPSDRVSLAVAMTVGSVALLVLGLQPLMLGAMLEAGQVTLEGVGLVAMGEIVALGLGVLLGDQCLPLNRLPAMAAVAALAAAGLDLQTTALSGDLAIGLTRAAAGVAEGVMVWSTTGVIVRAAAPERTAGLFFVVQTLAQALMGLVLARVVLPMAGWTGAWQVLAAMAAAASLVALALPGSLAPLRERSTAVSMSFRWSRSRAWPLLVVFLQLSTLGAFWAYAEPLGTRAGFSPMAIQTLIAAGLLMQVMGGAAGTALVRRLPVRTTLLACSAVLGLSALGVCATAGDGHIGFAFLGAAFTFTWLFMLPFQMGLAFSVDPSGRVASLVPALQLFGSAFGPLMASLLVTGENVAPVPLVAAGFALLSALALVATRRRSAD